MINYFKGKLCTIITSPINRDFQEEAIAVGQKSLYPKNALNYFMGTFQGHDNLGVMLESGGTKTYYLFDKIVAIAEEEVLDPNNPEDALIIERYKEPSGGTNIGISSRGVGRNQVFCPNGHQLKRPDGVAVGTLVACPTCQAQFELPKEKEEHKSEAD
jgi:hypothetical protein